VPAAGLEWLVFARPANLAKRPDLLSLLEKIFPKPRLDAFQEVTGVDLRRVRAGAIAGYPAGTLYLAELGDPSAALVRERFQARLDADGITRSPQANVHRVFGTTTAGPRALLTVDRDFIAVATDDTSLVRIVEGYVGRRLRSPSALSGAALRTLAEPPDDALAALYVPGPFEGQWTNDLAVLSEALGASVILRPGSPGAMLAVLSVAGHFAPDPATHGEALRRRFDELCSSPTGSLIGLSEVRTPKVVADLHHLTLTAELPLEPIVKGLHAATIGNVHEIFDVVPKRQTDEPAGSP